MKYKTKNFNLLKRTHVIRNERKNKSLISFGSRDLLEDGFIIIIIINIIIIIIKICQLCCYCRSTGSLKWSTGTLEHPFRQPFHFPGNILEPTSCGSFWATIARLSPTFITYTSLSLRIFFSNSESASLSVKNSLAEKFHFLVFYFQDFHNTREQGYQLIVLLKNKSS
jgi:hypothetical protein